MAIELTLREPNGGKARWRKPRLAAPAFWVGPTLLVALCCAGSTAVKAGAAQSAKSAEKSSSHKK
jgi:hypothetical protein